MHRKMSAAIAEKFGKQDVAERIDPHLTLKSPFEAKEMEITQLEKQLEVFSRHYSPAPLWLDEFGHFGNNVIYLDAETNEGGRAIISDLSEIFSDISWLELERDDTDIELHATLARPNNHNEFQSMMNYLNNQCDPDYTSQLDSFDLLVLEDGGWQEYTTFPLD